MQRCMSVSRGLFARLPDWIAVPEASFAIYGERGSSTGSPGTRPRGSLLIIELKTALVDVQALLARSIGICGWPDIARDRGWDPTA